jgi:hypothetical protein
MVPFFLLQLIYKENMNQEHASVCLKSHYIFAGANVNKKVIFNNSGPAMHPGPATPPRFPIKI